MGEIKALVVNCSAPHYNLGARKCADWLRFIGKKVDYCEGDPGMFGGSPDAVYLSVVFSWHALKARDIAMRYTAHADVYCGGPGMFALAKWWKDQTGLDASRGLDARFENQIGDYMMTFASRGCPVNCSFCIVPRLEGVEFSLNWEFRPAPILCDNNLSALPVEFQNHIIQRYRDTGTALRDANSGFEPMTFDEGTYSRWKPILKGAWRFAFDITSEEPQVRRMMAILKDETPRRKQVYVLIGNEPIEACYERARKVIEWGGEPYCQALMPLNALSRAHLIVRHDWTADKLRDMQRYFNRHIWRSIPIHEYRHAKSRPAPFPNLKNN